MIVDKQKENKKTLQNKMILNEIFNNKKRKFLNIKK